MMELKNITLERMNNGAHYLYVSNILANAEKNAQLKTKASAQLAALKTALAAEDDALKLSQKSLLTDDIMEADRLRDALYNGYKKAVKGFLNLPDETMAAAARVLNQHIIDYGISTTDQLDKETGLLINFVTDLEGKYATQVSTLSLTPFVTALKGANEQVRTFTAQRTQERMLQPVGALKKARRASDEAYRTLVKWVNALALIEGEKDYASFIDYANTEVTHYKREVIGQKADATATSGNTGGTPTEDGGKPSGGGSSDDTDEGI